MLYAAPRRPRAIVLATALLSLTPAACQRNDRAARAERAHTPRPGTPDPALSSDAAQALGNTFHNAGSQPVVESDTVRADGHVIRVRVTVGQVDENPDGTVAAIDVGLEVDGNDNTVFRVSSVAIDSNRAEAIQRAIREWSVAYAMPIVDALRATSDASQAATPSADAGVPARPAPFAMGRFQVFAGPTGIRGDAPATWRRGSELHRALLARFEPALEELFPPPTMPGFHTLKLTVHVRNGAAGEGECMVDGRPNARLCQLAREHAWPAGDSDFLFKQYYVLAPASR